MPAARQAIGLATLLAALALPASAPAQSGDPAQGSPSGVIYEIPLDNARRDAAPTPGGGRSGGGQRTATISPIRSENGFGSSSTVPGAAARKASASASGGKSKSKSGKSGGQGSGGAGGQGSGGAAAPAISTESIGGQGSASITPSRSRAYLLLLLALAVAAGLGIAGRYVARRR
jgi:hypothetical protein